MNGKGKDQSKCIAVYRSVNSKATRLDRLNILNVMATQNGIQKPDDIFALSQSYLMLLKQTKFINTMFGFRVSFYSLNTYYYYGSECWVMKKPESRVNEDIEKET